VQEFKAADIVISHPWSRATPKGTNVGAGYLVLENRGTTPDRLLGGSVEVAAGFEIHDVVVFPDVAECKACGDSCKTCAEECRKAAA
jgi:copper(I)-binding protein